MKWIKLGSWLELLIKILTLNTGEKIALWIAKTFFNLDDCGCCRRREIMNRWTNKEYDGDCNRMKLF